MTTEVLTEIVPAPAVRKPSAFPNRADRQNRTYNTKAEGWAVSIIPATEDMEAAGVAAHTNAVAAKERAQIADAKAGEASDSAAAAAADALRLASLDALWLGALAADPATGRNGAPLAAGNAYVNTATGYIRAYNGTAWVQGLGAVAGVKSLAGQMGDLALKTVAGQPLLGAGDIGFVNSYGVGEMYTGINPPSEGVWLKTGELYLKSQYPELAAALPVSRIPLSWSPEIIAELTPPNVLTGFVISLDKTVVMSALFGSAGSTSSPLKISRDFGVTWEDATLPTGFASTFLSAVDKTTGTFYFAGFDSVTNTLLKLASTRDFISWTVQKVAPSTSFAMANGIQSMAAGGGVVMLQEANLAGRYIASDNDGVSWAGGLMPGAAALWACAHTEGQKFVAIPNAANRAATYVHGAGWTARTTVAGAASSGDVVADGLNVFAPMVGTVPLASTDGGATWATTAPGAALTGKGAISGTARAVVRSTDQMAARAAIYEPVSANPAVSGDLPQLAGGSAPRYSRVVGHDGVFLFISESAAGAAKTRVVRIDSYGYNRSTHFYVPRATPAAGFEQWVRAKDYA